MRVAAAAGSAVFSEHHSSHTQRSSDAPSGAPSLASSSPGPACGEGDAGRCLATTDRRRFLLIMGLMLFGKSTQSARQVIVSDWLERKKKNDASSDDSRQHAPSVYLPFPHRTGERHIIYYGL